MRRLLLVPKKNGNQRPEINLKQDGTSKLSKRTFDKRDYMCKLELKNARFYIPLNMKRYEPIIQEICSILAGRQLVRVRRPLFWTKFSTSNFFFFYENPFATPTSYKHKNDYIFG